MITAPGAEATFDSGQPTSAPSNPPAAWTPV